MNDARLIDADKLIRWLEVSRANLNPVDYGKIEAYSECITRVATMETVEPMRHGQWMWKGRYKACSLCGSYINWDSTLGANHWKFCPYCGAKMDVKEHRDND